MTITTPTRRTAWMLCAAFLALGGCEQSNQGGPADAAADALDVEVDLAVDLAIPVDLSLVPEEDLVVATDLAPPVDASLRPDLSPLASCYAIHECIITTCAPGTIKACAPACMARGSVDAMKWFGPLLQCATPKCLNNGDCAVPNEPACNLCFTINCFQELMDCFNH